IIRAWASRVNFSITAFGTDTCPYTGHCGVSEYAAPGSSLAQLEAAALRMDHLDNTPMAGALAWAGDHFKTYFNDSNTQTCRPDYVVLMSDGLPNAYRVDESYACDNEAVHCEPDTPEVMARYNFSKDSVSVSNRVGRDMLCSVAGTQPIRTYTIGI